MSFVKMMIWLPILVIVSVFAFMNNTQIELDFWPFYLKITTSLSLVIVMLLVLGYIVGKFDSWLSYAPLRLALRSQLRQNKKLNMEQQKLAEKVEGLKGDLEHAKSDTVETDKPQVAPFEKAKQKFRSLFAKKPTQPKDDFWCL